MRILITGSNSELGQKLVEYCLKNKLTFIATSKGTNRNPALTDYLYFPMDICNKMQINQVFNSLYPTLVLHAATIVNPEKWVANPTCCVEVNVSGTELLFNACQQFHANFKIIFRDFGSDFIESVCLEKSKSAVKTKIESSDYKKWSIVNLSQDEEIDILFD